MSQSLKCHAGAVIVLIPVCMTRVRKCPLSESSTSRNAPQSVSVYGHPVEVTDNFVYLGSTVDSTGYSNPDILRRIGLASSVMGQLDRLAPEPAESCY